MKLNWIQLFVWMVSVVWVFGQRAQCNTPPPQKNAELADKANLLFMGMTPNETQQVIDYLMSKPELNLTAGENATVTSNYIYSIEHCVPKKTEVINWLDGKNSQAPLRMAQVILFMGQTRSVQELLVFPIPNPMFHAETVINRKDGNGLSWKARPVGAVDGEVIIPAILRHLADLAPLMNKMVSNYCDEYFQCASFQYLPRVAMDSEERHLLVQFNLSPTFFKNYYLLPIPLQIVLATSDNDPEDYVVREIYFNGNPYSSVDKLVEEYERDPAIALVLPEWNRDLAAFGEPDYFDEDPSVDDTRRPPAQFYPDGRRFRVDGHHVEWLKWSFDIHTRTVAGLQIFDLRYNGERIAYEISIQDIVVLYSGVEPDGYFKHLIDNGFGTGRLASSLVRGIDCPEGAIYLDAWVYSVESDEMMPLVDAICIFEHRNSVPLRRHYSANYQGSYRFAFSMPDSVLVVRQILTVVNYDYIYDLELHQNGVVNAKASSTGYIQMANNIPSGETKYGFVYSPPWNNNIGLFHQHLFNFKFDIDVGGTCNNFKTMKFGSEKVETKYSNGEDWYIPTMSEEAIESEEDAKIKYDFNSPKQYVIHRGCGQGSSSSRYGYRINSNGFNKLLLPDDSPLMKGALSWAKYQLAVTKHNDAERSSTSFFTQGDPFDPDVNFDRFTANNDRLVDTDLVAWITVGIHHLPTNEDIPVTTTPGKVLSASMVPFNYFEEDPSMQSRDAALLYNMLDFVDDYLHLNDTCPASVTEPSVFNPLPHPPLPF